MPNQHGFATLPHNIEAEEATLGAVLIDPESFDLIGLAADDFYLVKHRWLWAAFESLRKNHIPLDLLTVQEELEKQHRLSEIGGPAYLTRLITLTPTAYNAPAYANLVAESAERRRLIHAASEIAKSAYDAGTSLDVVRQQAHNSVHTNIRIRGGAEPINMFTSRLYDEVEARSKDPRDVWGIPTGFTDWDKITGGWQQGEAFILAGEPGSGKTLLLTQAALQAAGLDIDTRMIRAGGRPGAIYELEIGGVQLVRRVASAFSKIKARTLRSGRLEDDDWSKFVNAVGAISSLPVYLSDKTTWTTSSLRADLRRLIDLYGIEWFVVDYMQLLKDSVGANVSPSERVGHISQNLHDICKDLNLAGLFVQRLNKSGLSAGVPQLEHMSGSSQVPYDADSVAFITDHIPAGGEPESKNIKTVSFRKIREDDPHVQFDLATGMADGIPVFHNIAHWSPTPKPAMNEESNGNGNGKSYYWEN